MRRNQWYLVLTMLLVGTLILVACGGAESPTEAPAEPTDAPVVEPTDEPVVEPTDAPVVEPTDEPEDEATEEPVDEPTEEPEAGGDLMSVSAENCDYGGKILSIEAVDELTVVFNLCSPDPAFLAKVAFTPFGIQPSEWLEQTGGTGELLERPIGTGPYMIDQWVRGDSVVFRRFDDYWGEPAIAETAVLRWATEGAARLLELQTGNAHFITNVSPEDFETVQNDPNLVLLPDPNPNIFYLGTTNTFPPFDDVRVRQAIAMGIDRERIVENFYPPGSQVAGYFVPCTITNACEGDPWYDFDPEAARALLAEAGFPDGFETTIYYRDVFRVYLPEPGVMAQELQTQLEENLGITAEIQLMESGAFIDESGNGRLDGFHMLGWGADYPHVTNFLDFHFGRNNLQFGDSHPEIYEILEQAAAIVDPAESAPLYADANNAIRELVPMVPIAHGASADAALASLGGSYVPPFGATELSLLDPGEGNNLVFMQNAEPISLYCADETDGESLRPCQQVVEPLLKYELDSGETRGALATSCDPNEDGTVWTCSLRDGVLFHDGSTFDANDVVASWAVSMDASNPLHVGNTGAFFYPDYLWGGLLNASGSE